MNIDAQTPAGRERALTAAAAAVRRGEVVVVPTERVYAVAADAFIGTNNLRQAKGQSAAVSLPVLVASAAMVQGIAHVRPLAMDLMTAFWPGELTLHLPAQPTLAWDASAGNGVAVRMPIHPLTLALVSRTGPLATTAANRTGGPAPTSLDEVPSEIADAATLMVDVGPLPGGGASTLIDLTGDVPVILRHGTISADRIRSVCPDLVVPA
jgi:L-threonylcarbamoyladenylate synthase